MPTSGTCRRRPVWRPRGKTLQDHEDGACKELLAVIALNTTCVCACTAKIASECYYGCMCMCVRLCPYPYASCASWEGGHGGLGWPPCPAWPGSPAVLHCRRLRAPATSLAHRVAVIGQEACPVGPKAPPALAFLSQTKARSCHAAPHLANGVQHH
jgi:hypothetical protein